MNVTIVTAAPRAAASRTHVIAATVDVFATYWGVVGE